MIQVQMNITSKKGKLNIVSEILRDENPLEEELKMAEFLETACLELICRVGNDAGLKTTRRGRGANKRTERKEQAAQPAAAQTVAEGGE